MSQAHQEPGTYEKFAAVTPMLFTTESGWIVREFNFTLDGADRLEQVQKVSSLSACHPGNGAND